MTINLNDNLKKYKISIFGENYFLISDESESHILEVSKLVESSLEQMTDKNPNVDLKKLAIMVALQFTSKFLKESKKISKYDSCNNNLIDLIDKELLNLKQV